MEGYSALDAWVRAEEPGWADLGSHYDLDSDLLVSFGVGEPEVLRGVYRGLIFSIH